MRHSFRLQHSALTASGLGSETVKVQVPEHLLLNCTLFLAAEVRRPGSVVGETDTVVVRLDRRTLITLHMKVEEALRRVGAELV